MENEINKVYVCPKHVRCPHCDADIEGWMGDPRGRTDTCDHCKKEITIAKDAELVMDY